MVTVAVKKYCVKNGKEYEPYPKGTRIYATFTGFSVSEFKQEYLGKWLKPEGSVVQEQRRLRRE